MRATSFPALGSTATVVVVEDRAAAAARRAVEGELAAIDRACSRFRDDSELVRANEHAGESVEVSPLFAEALRVALDAADRTGGLVSPALGAQLAAAGYDRTFAAVRARSGWAFQPIATSGEQWRDVVLDTDRGRVTIPRGVRIDLGATAKALAADRAARSAYTATGCGVLVSLGGDIAVAGEAPSGGWCVRIAEDHAAPLDAAGPAVAIESGGLATSSITVRRWPTSRGEAHHVIDPRTGAPARSRWRTATVAAASCVDANVAATALLVDARFADACPLAARLVANDGTVTFVNGWPQDRLAA